VQYTDSKKWYNKKDHFNSSGEEIAFHEGLREGGADALNIVSPINPMDARDIDNLNGQATFPEQLGERPKGDGVELAAHAFDWLTYAGGRFRRHT
jgi:hypothetical protein